MKILFLSVGFVLMVSAPLAYSEPARDRTQGPCFKVTIQNDPVNTADVRQDCDRNVSRTVQAGHENHAQTVQTGRVNDNKVRQYLYERSKYFDRMRGN